MVEIILWILGIFVLSIIFEFIGKKFCKMIKNFFLAIFGVKNKFDK